MIYTVVYVIKMETYVVQDKIVSQLMLYPCRMAHTIYQRLMRLLLPT